jgi:trimeric autotransporter adhesin
MKHAVKSICAALLCMSWSVVSFAQPPAKTTASVPRLVKFSGTLTGSGGQPLSGVVGVTFALYEEERGGAPLWMETQNLRADGNGRYTAMLGATSPGGLPADPFTSGQARWVGVQAEGQPEQPRVLLVSSPYALKAGDAETIGGLPPSAFVLAAPPTGSAASPSTATAAQAAIPADTPAAVTGSGKANYIPLWSTATKLGSSVLFQSGTGATAEVGINTATPASTLDVNGATTLGGATTLPATGTATDTEGYDSESLNLVASAYNTRVSEAIPQTFQLQAEPVGNGTAATSGVLSLLYGSGTSAPAETGLKIAGSGRITFAAGQTFPGAGTGTVTSVGSGAGLTGGPITSSGALSVATRGVTNAMLSNPSLTVNAGTDLTGGGAVTLGGTTTLNLDITKVPQLNSANTFTASQTVNGILSATGVDLDDLFIGSYLFASGSYSNQSAFLGFAGNGGSAGGENTAIGYGALGGNPTGSYNTATGASALAVITTGIGNTAAGYGALNGNTTGGYNTATGGDALFLNTTGSGNTASGAYALSYNTVGYSNTAAGYGALGSNTAGNYNTATGYSSLYSNTTGNYNTATGYLALQNSTTGNNNTATGWNALGANANTGSNNTASGVFALGYNTTGNSSTATGHNALNDNTTGNYNTATGDSALAANTTGSNDTAVGYQALMNTTGSSNIALGAGAGSAVVGGSNNIDIGSTGASGDNAVINIGTVGHQTSAYFAGISNSNVSGAAVLVNSNGQLGVAASSRRYKEDIQDMGAASDGLMRLRPVTFRYKKPFTDGSQPMQYGLIAEEVAEVYPDLVARSADGQIETVKYQLLDPMLLNELQKQKEQIRSLEERLAKLEAALERTTVTAASR